METFYAGGIDKYSDGALVAATKRGDTHAFDQLVLRHEKKVLAAALRITKNREDAEDVAQECFHKAFLHFEAFQEQSRFSTWLTRIAINEAFMLLRRGRRVFEVLPASSDDDVASVAEAFVDQGPNPEESYWLQERTEHLTEAINRLGPNIRRTILLGIAEERSVQETARILGTSISAVKSRICRGRRQLCETGNLRRWRGAFSARPLKIAVRRGAVSRGSF